MTHLAHHPIVALAGQAVARVVRTFNNRFQAAKLCDLSDEQLKDIGLTRSDVRRVLARPLHTDPAPILNDLAHGAAAPLLKRQPGPANTGGLQAPASTRKPGIAA